MPCQYLRFEPSVAKHLCFLHAHAVSTAIEPPTTKRPRFHCLQPAASCLQQSTGVGKWPYRGPLGSQGVYTALQTATMTSRFCRIAMKLGLASCRHNHVLKAPCALGRSSETPLRVAASSSAKRRTTVGISRKSSYMDHTFVHVQKCTTCMCACMIHVTPTPKHTRDVSRDKEVLPLAWGTLTLQSWG